MAFLKRIFTISFDERHLFKILPGFEEIIDSFDFDADEVSDIVTSIHEMKDRINNNLVMQSIVEFCIQQLVFFLLSLSFNLSDNKLLT